MICPFCGAENPNFANFCKNCSAKLKTPCDCWVKGTEFDCGRDRCPGYSLFQLEQQQSLAAGKSARMEAVVADSQKQYSKAEMLSMYNEGKITKREVKQSLGLPTSDADDVLKVNIPP